MRFTCSKSFDTKVEGGDTQILIMATLEATTKELLSYDTEDIYAILVKMKESFEHNEKETRSSLQNSPQFLHALYQAQVEMGCAVTNLQDKNEQPQ